MKNILSKLRNIFRPFGRVSTWSGNREKSGKTEKIDKSQVKIGVIEKSQQKSGKKLKNNRFCQFKITKFLLFKSLQIVEI